MAKLYRLPSKDRTALFNELSAVRDEVSAQEDAAGLPDTIEKAILDRALNALLEVTQ